MVATSGARLISDDAIKTLTDELLPLAAVLTPNIPEAEVLSGMKISDEEGMIAIQIADYFILRRDVSSRRLFLPNMIVWAAGFIVYRLLMNADTPVGYTLVDMVITIALCVAAAKITGRNE